MKKNTFETLRERAFRCAMGARMGMDTFAQTIEDLHDSGLWKEELKADGSKFETFREFAEHKFPPGLSMSREYSGIPVDGIIEQLMAANPNRKAIAYLGGKRRGSHGGGRNGAGRPAAGSELKNQVDRGQLEIPKPKGGNSAAYMADRLERDFPEIWARYRAGEIRSVTAAAIEAGLRSNPRAEAFKEARRAWNRMTKAERKQFAALVVKSGTGSME